jgi:AhpD family alkylhydroperoxidase
MADTRTVDAAKASFFKEYDAVFDRCSEDSLSPKLTHLITLACHLSACRCDAATRSFETAVSVGASLEELNLTACLCSCAAGPMAQDNYLDVVRSARANGRAGKALQNLSFGVGGLRQVGVPSRGEEAYSLDQNIFDSAKVCTEDALDKKSYHLVSLAACLVTRCSCAAGHIVEARNAGATLEEIARCACVASCVGGLGNKYFFLESLSSVVDCRACDC